MTLRGPDP